MFASKQSMVDILIGRRGLLALAYVEVLPWQQGTVMILYQNMAAMTVLHLGLHEEQGSVMKAIALVRGRKLLHSLLGLDHFHFAMLVTEQEHVTPCHAWLECRTKLSTTKLAGKNVNCAHIPSLE